MYVSPDNILGAQHDAGTVVARSIGGVISTGAPDHGPCDQHHCRALHNGLMMTQALILMGLYMFLP
jgi:hypothetical protein